MDHHEVKWSNWLLRLPSSNWINQPVIAVSGNLITKPAESRTSPDKLYSCHVITLINIEAGAKQTPRQRLMSLRKKSQEVIQLILLEVILVVVSKEKTHPRAMLRIEV